MQPGMAQILPDMFSVSHTQGYLCYLGVACMQPGLVVQASAKGACRLWVQATEFTEHHKFAG